VFSYYGSKSKIIDLYPAPKYGKIIEPFAGSARYALKYWDREVLLVDKYEVIVKVWHYLQQASPGDILGLPEPKYKQSICEFNISEGERLLLGFLVARGVASPQKIVQMFSGIKDAKIGIISNLPKIRHWTIKLGSYEDLPNIEASYFIDPPYQFGGEHYKCNNKDFDFPALAQWSKSRLGQVIVCENTKADWLPFFPIGDCHGAQGKTTEAMWCNDLSQPRLF